MDIFRVIFLQRRSTSNCTDSWFVSSLRGNDGRMSVGYTLWPPLTTRIALQSARTMRSSPRSPDAALFIVLAEGEPGMTDLAQASAKQTLGWVWGLHRGGGSEGHQGLHGVNARNLYLSKTSSLLSPLPFLEGVNTHLGKLLIKPSPASQQA